MKTKKPRKRNPPKKRAVNLRVTKPAEYYATFIKEICDRLAEGEPLEQICRDERMPSSRTLWGWLNEGVANVPEQASNDIARAREIGYDAIANNLRAVARGKHPDATGDVQRDKLIIWTDLQLLSKWSKKYGERQDVEVKHSGAVGIIEVDAAGTQRLLEHIERRRADKAQEVVISD